MKLREITSIHSFDELVLVETPVLIGRGSQTQTAYIDLKADSLVSRRHARIIVEDDVWWLQDLESKNGTFLNEARIERQARISPGDEFRVGSSVFVLEEEARLSAEIDVVSAINYSLYHCGRPFITRLILRNESGERAVSTSIKISIPGFVDSEPLEIHPVAANDDLEVDCDRIRFHFHPENLLAISEKMKATVEVRVDDQIISTKEVWLLPYNEWSLAKEHRIALACFVQPNSPVVQLIEKRAVKRLKQATGKDSFHALLADLPMDQSVVDTAIEVLYECLSHDFDIQYVRSPVSFEAASQRIRLPDQVIQDDFWGEGTCIDLAILLASCLEHIELEPQLILVDLGSNRQHVVVGCRRNGRHVAIAPQEIICSDKEHIRSLAHSRWSLVLDSIGFASNADGEKQIYEKCCHDGLEYLDNHVPIYALDIERARMFNYPSRTPKLTPLSFTNEPVFSLRSLEALDNARRLAEETHTPDRSGSFIILGNPHLFAGMLELSTAGGEGALTIEMVNDLGVSKERAKEAALLGLPNQKASGEKELRPTFNFRTVKERSRRFVRAEGSFIVQEIHLLLALLHIAEKEDRAMRKILNDLGLDVDQCIEWAKEKRPKETVEILTMYSTYYEGSK